jgi:hypothetical protein
MIYKWYHFHILSDVFYIVEVKAIALALVTDTQ